MILPRGLRRIEALRLSIVAAWAEGVAYRVRWFRG